MAENDHHVCGNQRGSMTTIKRRKSISDYLTSRRRPSPVGAASSAGFGLSRASTFFGVFPAASSTLDPCSPSIRKKTSSEHRPSQTQLPSLIPTDPGTYVYPNPYSPSSFNALKPAASYHRVKPSRSLSISGFTTDGTEPSRIPSRQTTPIQITSIKPSPSHPHDAPSASHASLIASPYFSSSQLDGTPESISAMSTSVHNDSHQNSSEDRYRECSRSDAMKAIQQGEGGEGAAMPRDGARLVRKQQQQVSWKKGARGSCSDL